MSIVDGILLPRRISLGSCKIVSTQLKSRIEQYEGPPENKKLPAKVKEKAERLIARIARFDALTPEELAMALIDTCTDRTTRGVEELTGSFEKIYNAPQYIPLNDTQQQRVAAARAIYDICFPNGLAFLNFKFAAQWIELDRIHKALTKPEMKAHIAVLGIAEEIDYLFSWIDKYGDGTGITRPRLDPNLVEAVRQEVDGWHIDWKKFTSQVHAEYDDDNEEHVKMRTFLLSPYDERVEAERQEEREDRAARQARAEQKAKEEAAKGETEGPLQGSGSQEEG